MLSGPFASVSFQCLLSSLPPTCPRTRPKDAKSPTSAAELRRSKSQVQMSGEGGFEPPGLQGRTTVTRVRVVRLQSSAHSQGDVDGNKPQDDHASLETRGALAQPHPPPLPDRSALPLTELLLRFGHATTPSQSGPAHSSASRAEDFRLSGGDRSLGFELSKHRGMTFAES